MNKENVAVNVAETQDEDPAVKCQSRLSFEIFHAGKTYRYY